MKIRVPLLPRWLRWGFVVGIAGFIFYTSILNAPPSSPIDTLRFELIPLDKWRHFLAYGVLTGAILYATVDWQTPILRRLSLVIGLAFIYGIGIEFGQSLIPNRHFSLMDGYANFLGTTLITPWYLLRRYVEFVEVRAWVAEFTGSTAN